ncbi:MAG: hypothetical protein ACREVW_04005 [Burkholderiales bacterium]
MSLLRRTLVTCLLACTWSTGHAQMPGKPLVEPEPVAIPAGVNQATVVKAIKRALIGRDWSLGKEQPGYIEGTLNVRKHMVKVGISYDAGKVTMKYLDSAEMGYREVGGKQLIHPKYRNWTTNVMSDIGKDFQIEQLEAGR